LNCLACRRLLLSSPRQQSAEQRAHVAECQACARLMAELADLDWQIEEAALVPVPDAIAHRILLAPHSRPVWHYAAAAAVLISGIGLALLLPRVYDAALLAKPVETVGPSHPAVAAISLVVDDRAKLAREGDTAEMDQRLKELGLKLDSRDVHAYYAGKCQLPGSECDLIVLEAPDAHANVVLVLDYPIADQVLVADRRMIALVNPAKSGGYIVVADSPKVAKRMQRLFRRG
jgi:Protein of unknown function (DUF3379)